MEIFAAIDRAFMAYRASGRVEEALGIWRGRRPQLMDVASVDDLITRCRGPEIGSRREKDRIHVALCLEASAGGPGDVAGVALCWLFLPGMSELLKSLGRGPGVDADDVAADLLAGLLQAARRVRPSSRHLARHLLRGARRQVLRGLRRANGISPTTAGTGDQGVEEPPPDVLLEDPLRAAIDAGVLCRKQAELVLATRSSIADVAARHGLSVQAAQQARHRSRQRLRGWLTDS